MSPERDTREWSSFLFRACHDLRTQVRAIRTTTDILLQGKAAREGADSEQQLTRISGSAVKLDKLVDGLAHFAVALEMDGAEFQPVDLGFLARTVAARLEKEMRPCAAELSFRNLPTITGHPDRLLELLEILVRNSLVHRGAAPPRIEIAAYEDGDSIRITVHDNGPGVPDHFLESIFRPFEKLDGKSKDGPGLGLAIAAVIVERHGGRIRAESGDGMTVVVTLPKL